MSIVAFTQMAASFAFATMAACLAHREIRSGRMSQDIVTLLIVFLGVQSLQIMVAGLCGLLTGAWVGGASSVGLVLLATVPCLRRRICECLRGLARPLILELAGGVRRNPCLAAFAMITVGYVALHVVMFVVISPPLTFDALTYHLSKVAQWLHSESIYLPDLPVKRVFWPSGMELLNCWWALFTHNELFIEMPGLFFHALAAMAVFAVARNMGLGRRPSAYAALVFALTPAIVGHGSTCLTDLPTAALLYSLLALWTRTSDNAIDSNRRWLLSAAILFLAIGVKPTIVFMLPAVAIPAIPFLRRRDFTALTSVHRAPAVLWTLAALALFLGSFWYVRNAIRFGNPLYPVVAGTNSSDGMQSGTFSLANLAFSLRMLIVNRGILDGGPIVPNLYRMTGWGWFAVACGIPCSVFFALSSRRFAFLLAGQVAAMLVVLGTVAPYSSCLRFILWIPGALAIGFVGAVVAGRLPRPVTLALTGAAVATSALNLFTGLSNAPRIDWVRQAHHVGYRSNALGYHQKAIAINVPENEDIAVFMGREDPLYLAYGPSFRRGVRTIDAVDGDIDFAGALDEAGVRFLFLPAAPGSYPTAMQALQRQIDEGSIIRLARGLYVRNQAGASTDKEETR